MSNTYYIESFSHVKNGTVYVNGEAIFKTLETDFKSVMKAAYKNLIVDYPKFFKMDNLSKLGVRAAEVLLKEESEKNMAMVFSNRASSLDTDRGYQDSIKDPTQYYPSPAVFVYTLANILMGEISIKHKIYSENCFFITEEFFPETLSPYTTQLLDEKKAEKVICGWVDVDNGKYNAFLYVVAKKGTFVHSDAEINRLYKTINE
ncbi:3-oxoacyl-ACP synthase [Maribacter litopenaei]|uniref:3-oxoacyl-ACP synthase n=1 Tax=Maribacter litopenaei TaxID=2976127 RepID=A0ABY5Y8D6_9FLAO|nr:3-oxoacyl-ACP synthase [Maribacter litopenaei]UWX55286.1 3-oxoacyl-ACP synthase [Maribacter litopenaei]